MRLAQDVSLAWLHSVIADHATYTPIKEDAMNTKRLRGLVIVASLAVAGLISTMALPVAQADTPPIGTLKQFKVPTGEPRYITTATDGNLWFTASGPQGQVSRITPAGDITEFNVCNCQPDRLVQGPDGIIYFDAFDTFLGRITTSGEVLDPVEIPGAASSGLAADETSIWFSDRNHIGRYNVTTGAFTFFGVPSLGPNISDIEVAPDGTVWFAESNHDAEAKIGRLNPATGSVTEFVVNRRPRSLAIAPDGAVWFTEIFDHGIGRLIPATGEVNHFPTAEFANPEDIVAGEGSNLWFTQWGKGNIARISSTGVITEAKTVKFSGPLGITIGPDGNPWYTQNGFPAGGGDKVATVRLK